MKEKRITIHGISLEAIIPDDDSLKAHMTTFLFKRNITTINNTFYDTNER